MKPIRIAQIGINTHSHGPQIFKEMKLFPELFEIVGYVLPERERERLPEKMKVFDGYPELSLEEVLNDPTIEAVTVETDEIYLTKYAKLAAEAGKHVHMEKPGSPDLREFEGLIGTVKNSGKVFHVAYMYRYNEVIRDLISKVKAGALGQIVSVEAQMSGVHPLWVRNWLAEMPAGMMWFLGCHLVDLILLIQGLPEKVIPLNKRTGYEDAKGTDFAMAVFEYEKGVSFLKTTDVERGGFMRRQLVVTGTEGTVEIRPLEVGPEASQTTFSRTVTDLAWGADEPFEEFGPRGRYAEMMKSFAAYVRGEKENPYTPDYELAVFNTLRKACGLD